MAAKTAAPKFVALVAGEEIGRYSTKGSANRAARGLSIDGNHEVVTVEEFDARQGAPVEAPEVVAEAAPVEPTKAELDEAVVAEATAVVDAEVSTVKRDRLAPASKKLTTAQKRALATWYRGVVKAALESALEEETTDDNEGEAYLPAWLEASAADIEAQVGQWLSYLPKVEAEFSA